VTAQTQTGYVLALHFDLVTEELRPAIVSALVQDIELTRKMHISTGFVGTPYISQVLIDVSRVDLAYALLLQKTFPSWLYSVLHGATTIWERWDGWTEEHGFHDPGMNSFNHYAYGAVGAWMYENIAGIRTDPTSTGFKHIILQPRIPSISLGTSDGGLTFARGEYQSPYGLIKSHWRIEVDSFIWEVTVPPNTTATAFIPAEDRSQIFEGAVPIKKSTGVELIRRTQGAAVYGLQSGNYRFTVIR
jgi:alpha-L-rhamnosidase